MARTSLGCFVALLAALVVPAADAAGEATPAASLPAYFEGFDPAVPALETYRDWPPRELIESFYGLPWSHRSFRRAALFGQPVFFVLTVDWNRAGQRLATETLQDPELLHALNQGYISVIVNADLRPDLRERYQTGGWPVIAFLLPDGNPILSLVTERGLAKPITTSSVDKETLLFLLRQGALYWSRRREELMSAGARWAAEEGAAAPDAGPVDASSSEVMARWLLGNADREQGGFGAGAKFLVGGLDEYAALREARGLPALRRHSRLTLETMIASPLYDAREGGMHRLATSPSFGGIQYEKLLTVNSSLLRELISSLRQEDSPDLRTALKRSAEFLLRTLARPGGGFFQAQSADPHSDDGGRYWQRGGQDEAPPINRLVLSGPNAMAGAAMIRAGVWLGEERYVEAGRAALDLVYERAYQPGRGVGHAIEPMRDPRIYLATQVDVALAFLDAVETTGTARYLDAAENIVAFVRANLKDPKDTTYRDHLPAASPIGLLANERRPLKPNVRLARAMLGLARHGRGEPYREEALVVLGRLVGDLSLFGVHGVEGALAVEEAIGEPLRVVVNGEATTSAVRALRREAVNSPWPWTTVLRGADDGPPLARVTRGGRTLEVTDAGALREAMLEVAATEER